MLKNRITTWHFFREAPRASFLDCVMRAFHCIISKGPPFALSRALNECIHFCLVSERILGSWSSDKHWVFPELPSNYEESLHTFCWTVASNKALLRPADPSKHFLTVPFAALGETGSVSSVLQVSKLSTSMSSPKSYLVDTTVPRWAIPNLMSPVVSTQLPGK